MLEYEGGGHKNAGTCQVPSSQADKILDSILCFILEEESITV
jgi:nanoRNase/pAp phosphatase (c-di-AMP/oligoRNAs hydrolase)